MRLLLVTRNFPPLTGGSCVVYHYLCRCLGGEAQVLAGSLDRNLEERWDAGQPYRVYRMAAMNPSEPARRRDRLSKLVRGSRAYFWKRSLVAAATVIAIRRGRAEAVCIGSFQEYWLAAFVRRAGIPVVFYTHAEELTSPDESRFVGTGHFEALRKAEGVVAVSRFTRDKLVELGVREDRIELIPNGIDLQAFTPGEKDAGLLKEYGLSGKRILLTVGRLTERKGHSTVLRALPRILESFPDVVYVAAGPGRFLREIGLPALAKELGVEEHVRFVGTVEAARLCDLYRACEIFVMPNYTLPNGETEGFGLVFLEAAACGKPVIGGRDGGVPDAVIDGETGLLINGASVEEFAEAAMRLLGDRELAARMGARGLERVQSMDWKARALAFRSFCEGVQRRGTGQ